MINKVILVGNVGREPEMRFTPNGNPVTSFSVATNESYTDSSGEKQKRTEWFNVVTWNKLAENCNQFLSVGSMVYVEGKLQTRSWEAEDGQKKYRTEVIAFTVRFLSRRETTEGEPGEAQQPSEAKEPVGELELEDIPF